MKTKHFTLMSVFLLSVSCVALADRTLEETEIQQIFERLTSQPRKTWISAGTIEATHKEYKAPKITDPNEIKKQTQEKIAEYQSNSEKHELTENLQKMKLDAIPFNVRHRLLNEYTMDSSAIVKFDGSKFYWQINVTSRTDSVKPDKDLEGNFMTDQFDLNWNAKRIFAWDGEKYTTYFLPGNHAIVDTTGKTPHSVNGPLTAGIVPWGYGYYSYNNLISLETVAIEKEVDNQKQTHLMLSNPDGSQMIFVLDPQKDYAVISCVIDSSDFVISKQYGNHQLINGDWIPRIILLERFETGSNSLLSSDSWDITRIDTNVPESCEFDVVYEAGALIEQFTFNDGRPEMYHHSQKIDTDQLLVERLAFTANEGNQLQNCATASMKYSIDQLGKDVANEELAPLVSEPDKTTSLYEMKRFAQELGLSCRAVKTDIKTLKNLNGCKAILHIPGKNHFVVLDSVDDEYVWTIDLTSNKFYYRTDIDFFGMDWSDGKALLLSNNPISGEFANIEDDELRTLIGAAGYSCTKLLQAYNVIFCTYAFGTCWGYYQEYYTRYGCEYAASGSCSSSMKIRYAETPCIVDPYDILACTGTGEWTCYYMRACL